MLRSAVLVEVGLERGSAYGVVSTWQIDSA